MATGATTIVGTSSLGGRAFTLRPRGLARFPAAAFLAFWLCGWAAGEVFVAVILIRGAIALLTGRPLDEGSGTLESGPTLAAGAFLLCWLTFWTAGGLAALHQLLKLVWSEDRITIHPGGLTIVRRLGPVPFRRDIPRDALHRVYVPLATGELRAETSSGTVRLASLGTLDERLQLAEVMRTQLGLEDVDDGYQPTVPEGWEEIIDPEGGVSLVRDPKIRVTQSRVAGALAAVAALLAVFLGRSALENLDLLPITAVVSAVAFGLGWITLVLARARTEWRFEPGRLVLRRRFGRRVRELFTATALELSPRRDGDGDPWYVLEAVAAEHGPTGPRAGRKHRRRITYAVNDPTEPRRLGEWLASRAELPLRDLIADEGRAPDLAAVTAQLERAGWLGRLAARLLRRAK